MAPTDTTEDMSLTILSLAEPLLAADSSADRLTKSSLGAELDHYKDLFSKLRFSYVEQVTKERFLKAIVADPPHLVDAAENARLEQHLAQAKAALKAKKEHTNQKVQELQDLGTRLAQSHELIHLQTTQLHALPADIQNLDITIANLKAAQETPSSHPMLNLPLRPTNSLLAEKLSDLARLDREIAELQSTLPDKKRRVASLQADLEPIESRKRSAITQAKDAQKKRGQHVLAQDLDERGKWLKSVDTGLRLMLQV
ncbi:hypothetical protein M438DRAFT_401604 [Aureobasidium pullulans EXF-150]|uniref:Kinetochore protein Sos7 coiled-coil domain-containing protein n=1 Tax=Aureobasidium pullulans EXF-150 TaxID=1043002 RepID=A0A074XVI1_AURPU|nr:uncharacterized protein M438DRAFT_401604 [Aureobasidium pullulans EXF-150]KEQ89515.1 hypothetical protein M438DRAFT_401604 [Aureobasidium pullulans EXF-150]